MFVFFSFYSKPSGPEPVYSDIVFGYKTFKYQQPFHLKDTRYHLPELEIAYETWGELNEDRSNAVLIQAGLSASSHAKSHKVIIMLICMYLYKHIPNATFL